MCMVGSYSLSPGPPETVTVWYLSRGELEPTVVVEATLLLSGRTRAGRVHARSLVYLPTLVVFVEIYRM